MSELDEYFLRVRRLALGIVFGQLGITLLVSVAGLFLGGRRAVFSVLAGGGIGTLTSLYRVISIFRLNADADPAKILRRTYRAEFYKLVITASMFSVVLLNMDVSFGAMLGGFAATLTVYWAALAIRLPVVSPRLTSEHRAMSKH